MEMGGRGTPEVLIGREHLPSALGLLAATVLWGPPAFAELDRWPDEPDRPPPEIGGWSLSATPAVPLRLVERPLTLPKRMYEVRFDLGYTRTDADLPVATVGAGTGYGVDDDFEVGLVLLSFGMSKDPNTGLDAPRFYVMQRLLEGVLELAAFAEADVPVGDDRYVFGAALPARLHFGRWARLDGSVAYRGVATDELRSQITIPLELNVQVAERFALALTASAIISPVVDPALLGKVGLRASYAIVGERGSWGDLGVHVSSPRQLLRGPSPSNPSFGHDLTAVAYGRFFVFDAPDRGRFD